MVTGCAVPDPSRSVDSRDGERPIDRELAAVGLLEARVGIVLAPPLEVALQRDRERATKAFDTSILADVMRDIDADLRRRPVPDGWLMVDNGSETLATTVERVLAAARD